MYNPDKHRRRSIRLKDYDYSTPGAYFVTICTQDRACLFGDVVDGTMEPNAAGRAMEKALVELPGKCSGLAIDESVVMPNHVHVLFVLLETASGRTSLPDVIYKFKSWTTKVYSDAVKQLGWQPFRGRLWQRNYYEHIVRNGEELDRIREYITKNPHCWTSDEDNPANFEIDTS